MRWFFRSKKRDEGGSRRGSGRSKDKPSHKPTRSTTRSAARKHRDQPAPLTWTTPEQDFITRYGDPFDG